MNQDSPISHGRARVSGPSAEERWFATFSMLDISGTISSAQLRRLVAVVSSLWLTLRRPK